MEELASSFDSINYYYLIPVVAIVGVSYVLRVYRWQVLLGPIKKISASELFPPLLIGFMGNLLPGRAGEILRPYLLAKKFNLTFSVSFASVVVERVFDLVLLLFLFAWVFWVKADIFSSDLEFSGISVQDMAVKFGQFSLMVTLGLMVFIYLLAWRQEKLIRFVRLTTRYFSIKWRDKIEFLLKEFAIGCAVVKKPLAMSKVAVLTVLIWVANILSYYPLYLAFSFQNITIVSLLVLNVVIAILITVVPTPGFLGSYNAGVLIALHEIMNESEIKSVSFGMVSWGLFTVTTLVGGFYFVFKEHMSLKTLAQDEIKGEIALRKEIVE